MIKWFIGGFGAFAICCAGGLYIGRQAVSAQQEASKFLAEKIPPVIQTWDIEKLKKISHPQFLENNSDAVLKKNFAAMKARLGNGQSVSNWKNKGFEQQSINAMETTIVCVQGEGVFEKGKDKVTVWMTRDKEDWLITSFFIGEPPKAPTKK